MRQKPIHDFLLVVLSVFALVVALLTYLAPFQPIGPSPFFQAVTPINFPTITPSLDFNVQSQVCVYSDQICGQVWLEELGCLACHSIDGSERIGPSFLGLAGSERELTDGTVVIADEEYLRFSILYPDVGIVKGYSNGVMPIDYIIHLSENQIDEIIAFIRTLKN